MNLEETEGEADKKGLEGHEIIYATMVIHGDCRADRLLRDKKASD